MNRSFKCLILKTTGERMETETERSTKAKGEHLISRQKKRNKAKASRKALEIRERTIGRKKGRNSRSELRQMSKQLW